MKEKRCEKCGRIVKSYSHGSYCSTCANEVWDAGFQSTSEHAYEIGFYQLLDRLDKECNKDVKNAIIDIIRTWSSLEWKCRKCGAVRIPKRDAEKMNIQQHLDKICEPCTCGEKKPAKPEPPDKWFW